MKSLKAVCFCPNLSIALEEQIECFLETDADILILPEYLLELTSFVPRVVLNKFVVFGSRIVDLNNRAYFSDGNAVFYYDKQRLTPWEKHLQPGMNHAVHSFRGIKIAILICFDVEFLELSVSLQGKSVDLLVVPAATETELGFERVGRCASARAVELGCAVLTCHLIGTTQNPLIDVNVGEHQLFLPSQSLFQNLERSPIASPKNQGPLLREYYLPLDQLRQQRLLAAETNPSIT